ncbi:Prefoldin [Protomyces lactucae-debilis]|uniref:Prefoldin n=1 Tax=Protomyces lactucae-debilis TaxID=2754530 RepID=A0A1Y2FDU4_PROLT|nr:Prefoldin [Protomyces lactucae-debilis]ORY81594.1 Prefoldin [Protomyces lactucae-debilis]
MEDQLRKVLSEIEARAVSSQRELTSVKQALVQKQRIAKTIQLTLAEIDSLPKDTPLYQGVGKMFMLADETTLQSRLKEEKKSTEDEAKALEKKHEYLLKTYENARQHIQAAMQRQAT